MFRTLIGFATVTCATFIVAADAALAGIPPATAPAPLVGAGIPALIAFALGYRALKKRRGE